MKVTRQKAAITAAPRVISLSDNLRIDASPLVVLEASSALLQHLAAELLEQAAFFRLRSVLVLVGRGILLMDQARLLRVLDHQSLLAYGVLKDPLLGCGFAADPDLLLHHQPLDEHELLLVDGHHQHTILLPGLDLLLDHLAD